MKFPAALLFLLTACASASQGGTQFKAAPVLDTSPEPLFAVCWPADALSSQRVVLTFTGDQIDFETRDGATNSTGRCIREIASSSASTWTHPATLEVAPPAQPIDGWAVASWVRLLSSSRYESVRGVLDPASLLGGCGSARANTSFIVRHTPSLEVRVVPSALTDAERCIEAVLGATVWPSTRELFFSFPATKAPHAPRPGPYFAPDSSSTGVSIDARVVKDTLSLQSAKVASCWESALDRRPTLSGSRTFRFRVDDAGSVTDAWVANGLGDGPAAADLFLDRCLAEVLRGTHFPPAAGEGFYTWVFAQR